MKMKYILTVFSLILIGTSGSVFGCDNLNDCVSDYDTIVVANIRDTVSQSGEMSLIHGTLEVLEYIQGIAMEKKYITHEIGIHSPTYIKQKEENPVRSGKYIAFVKESSDGVINDREIKEYTQQLYHDLKILVKRKQNPQWQMFYSIRDKVTALLTNSSYGNRTVQQIVQTKNQRIWEKSKQKWYDMVVPCNEMTLFDNECSTLGNNRCVSYVSGTITLYGNGIGFQSSDQCRELSKQEREIKDSEKILCEQTNGRWSMGLGCICLSGKYAFQSLQDEFSYRQKYFRDGRARDDQLGCVEGVKACTEVGGKWIRDVYTEKHIPQAKTIEECIQLSIPNDWMQKGIDKNYKAYKSGIFSGYMFRFSQYENGAVNDDKLQYRNSDEYKCYERMYEHDGVACTGVEKFKYRH